MKNFLTKIFDKKGTEKSYETVSRYSQEDIKNIAKNTVIYQEFSTQKAFKYIKTDLTPNTAKTYFNIGKKYITSGVRKKCANKLIYRYIDMYIKEGVKPLNCTKIKLGVRAKYSYEVIKDFAENIVLYQNFKPVEAMKNIKTEIQYSTAISYLCMGQKYLKGEIIRKDRKGCSIYKLIDEAIKKGIKPLENNTIGTPSNLTDIYYGVYVDDVIHIFDDEIVAKGYCKGLKISVPSIKAKAVKLIMKELN